MELVPLLATMRVSAFLRSPNVYDPMQIFLQDPVSQEIGSLVCELDFSGAELICHDACILLELPSTAICVTEAGSTSTTLISM